ncbi:MAG: [protein-PII] uridylyltransferase, partial [Pseudomonadota bacterium]
MNSSDEITGAFLHSREALIERDLKKGTGLSATRAYADMADGYIKSLYAAASPDKKPGGTRDGNLVVMALGSYGRRELCLESDIDLLVIHQEKLSVETEEMLSRLLYPLWDAKLEVGHTVLTVHECIRLAMNDFRFLTSVMTARFLVGSRAFFQLFQETFWSRIDREKDALLREFLVYQQKREEKYSSQSYFVEPDMKEGLGGLRDLHFMAWMARIYFKAERFSQIRRFAIFSHFEVNRLNQSKSFLLKVRNHLHLIAGRKEDRLLLVHQKALSQLLGYKASPHISEAARFMRHYYLHMNRIRFSHEEFTSKTLDTIDPKPFKPTTVHLPPEFQVMKGNLVLQRGVLLQENPLLIIKAFGEAGRRGLFLGSGFIWEVRKRIQVEGKELVGLPGARKAFLDFIMSPKNPKIFRLALEIGLISLFIPEFKRVRNLAQFSYYHRETVDIHSLKTMEVIYELSRGDYDAQWPLLKEVFKELKHPEWLYMAGLLHDIGKGYRGDHSRKGAELIPRILKRLGVTGEALRAVPFLVEHHLLLADISQKRDLNEEKTSVQVAHTLQNIENLRSLLLLTVADSMATGTMAHSDWKIRLLIELFFKVKNILEKGTLASPDAAKKLESVRDRVLSALKSRFSKRDIMDLMDQVPTRYFLNTPYDDMIHHFQLGLTMGEEPFAWVLGKVENARVTRIVLCTYDHPGLFSKMVGVFTLNNIKVLSANIFTLKNGLAFDIYEVTNPLDPYNETQRWEKIREEILLAIEDRLPLNELMREKEKGVLIRERYSHIPGRKVRITNEISDFFTVIEIISEEQVGLLYNLAKKMYGLGLNIRFARINSDEEKMTGVFYVRDSGGQKIYEKDRIEAIEKG